MDSLRLSHVPVSKTGMLVRKPVAEVFEAFEAFVDPEVTTKFWFTRSRGRLEGGKEIRWDSDRFPSGLQEST